MDVIMMFAMAAIGTYLVRVSLVFAGARQVAPVVDRAIGLISPAVLAGIVAGALLVDARTFAWPGGIEVAALAVAVAATRRTGNVAAALGWGLPIYWCGTILGLA